MKILELTNFSAGICGVWTRVREEATRLSKNHEVRIFSSNFIKGSNKTAPSEDKIDSVKIKRFPARKLGGESFMLWNFEQEALKYKPDIIIAHSYRHPHTTKALKLAKKVFLVTHAPFVEENLTRSFLSKNIVKLYDQLIAPKTLNKFNKIIPITKWEMPHLLNLSAKKERIKYIPNGIPESFFSQKKEREENKILFLGRISPIKNLETLIIALSLIKNEKIKLEITGPAERDYLTDLNQLVKKFRLEERVTFSPAIYDLKKKITKIDSCKIFVLPSKREAMPQSLIEAMAREKIVIASSNPGSRELITNNKNGFLFETGNAQELAEKISLALEKPNQKIKKQAKSSVEQFSWDKIIKKIEAIL